MLPSDIAVLVRSSEEAGLVQQALRLRQIPAVLARGSSVLASPAATQWRWLLEALLRPGDAGRARTFALSWFGGLDPSEVAELDDETLGPIQERLQSWGDTLQTHGVSALVRRVRSESRVARRVLATADGDRNLTDLDHVAELLQTAPTDGHLGIAGLLAVLDTPPDPDIDTDTDGHVEARRVESDEQAVQIMTVWVAKGLQFPIVCCPTLWRHKAGDVIFHDPGSGRRILDTANKAEWPDKESAALRKQLADREALGENLRLLYVGLTRAQHHTLVWWSKVRGSEKTGLARVLFARSDGAIDVDRFEEEKVRLPGDDETLASLRPTLDRAGGTITAAVHGRWSGTAPWVGPEAVRPAGDLEIARLGRAPDRSRHRWSFTAITQRFEVDRFDPYDPTLSDGGAGDEQLSGAVSDDDDPGTAPDTDAAPPLADPAHDRAASPRSPLVLLPAGAEFGTMVHSVLERVDFASDDLDRQLADGIARELAWQPLDLTPRDDPAATPETGSRLLVAGLRATIETPLGPLFDDRRLRDLQRRRPARRALLRPHARRIGSARRRDGDRPTGRRPSRPGGPAAALGRGTGRGRDPRGARRPPHGVHRRGPPGRDRSTRGSSSSTTRPTAWDAGGTLRAPTTTPVPPSWRPWPITTTRSRPCCTRWRSTGTCGGGWPATTPTDTSGGRPTSSCGG